MPKTVVIQSTHDLAHKLCKEIIKEVKNCHFSNDDIFGIHLSIEEAVTNAVRHGNNDDPSKKVRVIYSVSEDKFEISVEDEGSGFCPGSVPDPRCGENIYKPCGRGLLLMKAYMDSVEYNKAGNCVRMIKHKSKV